MKPFKKLFAIPALVISAAIYHKYKARRNKDKAKEKGSVKEKESGKEK